MFNSVVLDVFISLAFLYLLYSLFVSILGEMIGAWLGLRPRIQRMAMEKMLNDKYHFTNSKYNWLRPIGNFFLYEFKEFQNSFAGRFYDHPGIKYLAKEGKKSRISFKNSKPCYFSKEIFSETLVQLLRSKGNGESEIERIKFVLKYNTHHIQPETFSYLNDLMKDSNDDMQLFREKLMKWFTETMYRTTGWYKQKLQLILFWLGFIIAMVFNVDSIRIAQQLMCDKDARKQMVELGIQASDTNSAIAKAIKVSGDTAVSDSLLKKSWNEIKSATDGANKVLGLGWDFDKIPLRETQTLKVTNGTATLLKSRFMAPIQRYSQSIDRLKKEIPRIKSPQEKTAMLARLKLDQDSLGFFLNQTNKAILNLRSGCFHLSDREFIMIESMTYAIKAGSPDITIVTVSGNKSFSFCNKMCYVISHSLPWHISFWGFVITALMLSLGAPFWFDLLKKIVSIRSAGIKPEDKEKEAAPSAADAVLQGPQVMAAIRSLPKTTSTIEEALLAFTKKVQHENGLVSIGITPIQTSPFGMITVNLADNKMIPYFKGKYGINWDLGQTGNAKIEYSVSSPIKTHFGVCGGGVANKNRVLGSGTIGCFLSKRGSDKKYILSCWHVLTDNRELDANCISPEIIEPNVDPKLDLVIGNIVDGRIADTFDIGIAECNENNTVTNKPLPVKTQHRAILPYDALVNTPVTILGNVSKNVQANIYLDQVNAVVEYEGDNSKRIIYDTFSITRVVNGANVSPTSAGDSGALVIDGNSTPLGMIIGGNDHVSYAIKFTNVFSKNKCYENYSFITT